MKLGTAKAIITPPVGTPLAGFGYRTHGSEEVLDDLEVRTLWFEDEADSNAVCIVTADIIGFDHSLADAIKASITKNCGIPAESILLCASHTHSGPQTCANMCEVGPLAPAVVDMIHDRIVATARSARMNLHPITIQTTRSTCEGFAINRRSILNGHAAFLPNPDGVRDDEVSVICCQDTDNSAVLAVLFHFTCHPTTIGDYLISAEYPGMARRYIERAIGPGAVAAFLPGCFGDVRPNCTYIGGRQFRRGTPDDLEIFGRTLGENVLAAVYAMGSMTTPDHIHGLFGKSSIVNLPLVQVSGVADSRPLHLQRIDLGEAITLIAMGGEVCCDYGHFVKQLASNRLILPLGYSNDILGYIPSARMFAEGGYEVEESSRYFGLPAPFTSEIEGIIHSGIRALM